jgi:transcriptional regulator with XRE-family HTH domain
MGCMPPAKQPRQPEVGPIGRNLIRAVERLRERRGLTYKKLSELLEATGRPIFPLGLSRLEKGERRVDADELVALAVVLGVNPNALLFPHDAERADLVDLTPETALPAWVVWEWADGRMPLPDEVPPFPHVDVPDSAVVDFAEHARPTLALRGRHPAVSAAEILLTRILRGAREMDETNDEWWHAYIRRALSGLTIALDDWFAAPPPVGEDPGVTRLPADGKGDADGRLRPMALVQSTEGSEREKVL